MKISSKIYLAIAAFLVIGAVFFAVSYNSDNGKERIIVAVDENPPYTYTTAPVAAYFDESSDNAGKTATALKFQGFDIDVIMAVADRAGLAIEFRDVPFADMLNQMARPPKQPTNFIQRYFAKKSDLDLAIGGISITAARKIFAEFTIPYASGGACIVALKSGPVTSPESLSGKLVGVELATTNMDTAAKISGAKLKFYRDQQSLLLDLLNGVVNAIVIDRIAAAFYITERKLEQLKIVNLADEEEFAMLARKGNTKLIDKINKALNEMKASGELQKLHDKWFSR
ncbi:MAG: transporter substrate-binding domain-containing protein [Bacillota bacterium]